MTMGIINELEVIDIDHQLIQLHHGLLRICTLRINLRKELLVEGNCGGIICRQICLKWQLGL